MNKVEYEIQVIGTFVLEIHSSVEGPPDLGRPQIEELIERDWASIAADKNVLLESSWELDHFQLRAQSSGS